MSHDIATELFQLPSDCMLHYCFWRGQNGPHRSNSKAILNLLNSKQISISSCIVWDCLELRCHRRFGFRTLDRPVWSLQEEDNVNGRRSRCTAIGAIWALCSCSCQLWINGGHVISILSSGLLFWTLSDLFCLILFLFSLWFSLSFCPFLSPFPFLSLVFNLWVFFLFGFRLFVSFCAVLACLTHFVIAFVDSSLGAVDKLNIPPKAMASGNHQSWDVQFPDPFKNESFCRELKMYHLENQRHHARSLIILNYHHLTISGLNEHSNNWWVNIFDSSIRKFTNNWWINI